MWSNLTLEQNSLTFWQHSNASSEYSGLLRTSIGVPTGSQVQELFCSSVKLDHKISISVLTLFAKSSVHFYSVVYKAKIDLAALSTVQEVQKCLRKRENVQSNKSEGQIASFGEQLPQKAKGKSHSKRLKLRRPKRSHN